MVGLKLTAILRLRDGIEYNFPALVSREVRPDSKLDGEWRLTVFSQDMTNGILHANFDLDSSPSMFDLRMIFRQYSTNQEHLIIELSDYLKIDCAQVALLGLEAA